MTKPTGLHFPRISRKFSSSGRQRLFLVDCLYGCFIGSLITMICISLAINEVLVKQLDSCQQSHQQKQ